MTRYQQELTDIALHWLSTTKYQQLLSYTDPVHSFITLYAHLSQLDLVFSNYAFYNDYVQRSKYINAWMHELHISAAKG